MSNAAKLSKLLIVDAADHSTRYRPDIDGLRAVAVLSVVAFHAFPGSLRGGFAGVDVFFVISGFLISTIIFENMERGTFRFDEFYYRRIRRIFPALTVMLLACYAFGWFALLGDEYMQLGKHIAAGAGFASNFAFWGEAGYFDNSAETKPLLHLWSLGVEEQYYILWPVLVWAGWSYRRYFVGIIGILAVASFAVNMGIIHTDSVAAFYSPLTRFWELLCGSLLAWATLHRADNATDGLVWMRVLASSLRLQNLLSMVGIVLLVFAFVRLHTGLSFPGKWALFPVLGAVCVIAAGHQAWFNRIVLSNPVMVAVGLISYPLYLWHWPLLAYARIIEGELPSATIRGSLVAVSFVLAWLTYRLIERPIRLRQHSGIKSLALVASMAAVGGLGFMTYRFEGLDHRAWVVDFKNNKNELIRTVATDSKCLEYVGTQTPLYHYCRFTDQGADETVAVIGDSHAHVAYPGIAEYFQARKINTLLIANSSCPPFLGSPSGSNEKEKRECRERIDALVEVLARSSIKTVVFFTRGPVYLTGTEPVTKDRDVLSGATLTPHEYADGLQRTVDQLVGWGKKVIYVSENPELARTAESCIPRPLRSASKDCRPLVGEVLARQGVYRALLSGLRNVTIIDSLTVFCPEDRCRVFDNGMLMYADADHLSVAGSRFQAKELLARFLD
jgi:peptidoglycan/LPS O-acetylase OafA/YrhL